MARNIYSFQTNVENILYHKKISRGTLLLIYKWQYCSTTYDPSKAVSQTTISNRMFRQYLVTQYPHVLILTNNYPLYDESESPQRKERKKRKINTHQPKCVKHYDSFNGIIAHKRTSVNQRQTSGIVTKQWCLPPEVLERALLWVSSTLQACKRAYTRTVGTVSSASIGLVSID